MNSEVVVEDELAAAAAALRAAAAGESVDEETVTDAMARIVKAGRKDDVIGLGDLRRKAPMQYPDLESFSRGSRVVS